MVLPLPPLDLIESQPAVEMSSLPTCKRLPAANGEIGQTRLDLYCSSTAADPLSGHHRRAKAREGVEDDIAASCAVFKGVNHEGDRLGGRTRAKFVHAADAECVHRCIAPDIAA